MSGSPICSNDGSAIGVVTTASGSGIVSDSDLHTEGGPEPTLLGNLPGWLLRDIAAGSIRSNRRLKTPPENGPLRRRPTGSGKKQLKKGGA
ncbi:MAG: hypothetical protein ABSH56_12895 [Bryobacteraceae bacterium]|jgi:hypothetical protein